MPYTKKLWQDRIRDAQGNIIQEGTPVSAGNLNNIENGIASAHAQLDGLSNQSATLKHGLNVITSDKPTLFEPKFSGRTLINLAKNSTTEAGKNYLALFQNPKVGLTIDGVYTYLTTKFQGAKTIAPILMADFSNKVTGSNVENPHYAGHNNNTSVTGLQSPSWPSWIEGSQNAYGYANSLNGILATYSTIINGTQAQDKRSFNLIEHIERNYGVIPRSTVADKVQWIKENLAKITINWYVFGTSPTGNKATIQVFRASDNQWSSPSSHSLGTVSRLSPSLFDSVSINNRIDSIGFIHYLAYAEPSDGVTASVINTDYVNIEVELKPDSKLRPTKIAASLYEVTAAEYALINVDPAYTGDVKLQEIWPYVDGVKAVTNPVAIAQGKNLLPQFTEWNIHPNAIVKSSYELELNATSLNNNSTVVVPVLPNQTYTISAVSNGNIFFEVYDANNVLIQSAYGGGTTKILTTPTNAKTLKVIANNINATGFYTFTNPQLELGATATTFEQKNEDYIFANVKLYSNLDGTIKDELYRRDGQWFKSKRWETVTIEPSNSTIPATGSGAWVFMQDYTGYKRFGITLNNGLVVDYASLNDSRFSLVKFDGKVVKNDFNFSAADQTIVQTQSSGGMKITVSDSDTGFADSYTPTTDEIKAYFNGWQVKTVDVNNKPTSWKSIVDGSDAPIQTLAYVVANKAAGYTPYELTYSLAVTKEEATAVEGGAFSLHSSGNQFEVGEGAILREKVAPLIISGSYYINSSAPGFESQRLKNRADKILKVYKNGIEDKKWSKQTNLTFTNGNERLRLDQADFDPTAEYTVSYLALDKHLQTANCLIVSGEYNTSIKTTVENLTKEIGDLGTTVSINVNAVAEMYKRLKAIGG